MKKITIRESLNKCLKSEMKRNPKIFILGEETCKEGGIHKVTAGISERNYDMPISETGFCGLAIGSSYVGLIPVVEFMTFNFSFQAIDHIINSCAKMRYMSGSVIRPHIVFRGPHSFSKGMAAQHTHDFCSFYGQIPGLTVLCPFSAKDHFGLLKRALKCNKPVVFLENEQIYENEFDCDFESDYEQEFGCVIEKEGKDVTLIGVGITVGLCLETRESVKNSCNVEVINLASIRPLDMDTIYKSVKKTKKCVIVEYGFPKFSVSSEISCNIYENVKGVSVKRLAAADCPTPYAENLESLCYPTIDDIKKAIGILIADK